MRIYLIVVISVISIGMHGLVNAQFLEFMKAIEQMSEMDKPENKQKQKLGDDKSIKDVKSAEQNKQVTESASKPATKTIDNKDIKQLKEKLVGTWSIGWCKNLQQSDSLMQWSLNENQLSLNTDQINVDKERFEGKDFLVIKRIQSTRQVVTSIELDDQDKGAFQLNSDEINLKDNSRNKIQSFFKLKIDEDGVNLILLERYVNGNRNYDFNYRNIFNKCTDKNFVNVISEAEALEKTKREQAAASLKNEEKNKIWSEYNKRQKTVIEQTFNYTTTGKVEGDENKIWIGSKDNKCVITEYGSDLKRGNTVDVRKYNQTAFRISVNREYFEPRATQPAPVVRFGDDNIKDFNWFFFSSPPIMDRLKTAWGIAFKECPGQKSAF